MINVLSFLSNENSLASHSRGPCGPHVARGPRLEHHWSRVWTERIIYATISFSELVITTCFFIFDIIWVTGNYRNWKFVFFLSGWDSHCSRSLPHEFHCTEIELSALHKSTMFPTSLVFFMTTTWKHVKVQTMKCQLYLSCSLFFQAFKFHQLSKEHTCSGTSRSHCGSAKRGELNFVHKHVK